MATILTKKKDTTGAPSAGDLTNSTGGAELAVNTADKRLYTKDSGGNVVEIGTNPTSITTGTLNTSGAVVFNDAGADVDFRVEGDTNANLLFVDASTDRVGIGTDSPSVGLEVSGGVGFSQLKIVRTGGATANFGANSIQGFVSAEGSAPLSLFTNSTERMRIDSSGNLLVGTTTTPSSTGIVGVLARGDSSYIQLTKTNATAGGYAIGTNGSVLQIYSHTGTVGSESYTEHMRLTGSALFVGKTAEVGSDAGFVAAVGTNAYAFVTNTRTDGAGYVLGLNRQGSDGNLIEFRQANTAEGTIAVSGNTISYNPFLGSHSGALADWSKPDIKIGTVMDTIDELLEYKVVVIDVQEEVPAKEAVLDEEGNQVEPAQEATTQTVQKRISYNGNGAVGSSATVEYEGQEYTGTIQNEREEPLSFNKHLKVKINDTAASKAVFGVFVGWNNDINNDGGVYNDMLVGAVGNYVIRMAAGQEPQIGDLVEADGNGCAVVQDDDIIRTKTVAKVTSTIKQVTYDDGSFLVTCVLYCG